MDVCLVRHAGERVLHRHMTAAPQPCLKAVAPYRAGLVVAVACLCPWYGLADRGAAPDLPLVPGHTLDRPAIHGGTATHDPLASPKMAARRRGGMLPTASVYPAERQATRDLWRRTHRMRPRAERLSPGSKTHAQDHWPAIGQHLTSNTPRAGVAARVHAPAVPTTLAVDLALLTAAEALLRDVELALLHTANPHEAHPLAGLQTGSGMGTRLRLVRLDDSHDCSRVPHGQDGASYARWVTWRQEAAGTRWGPSGTTSGHAHRTGAFPDAATGCLRHHPNRHKRLTRVENTQGYGHALTIVPHTALEPSLTGARAPRRSRWSAADRPHGAARGSPRSHWTRTG